MNYVSFSLFGDRPDYCVGAIRNAEQIKKFYPGFVPLFYTGPGVPESCLEELKKLGSKFSSLDASKITSLRMWRFAGIEETDASIVLVRDVDSRFSDREVRAVEQWIESDELFHVMRDYSGHNTLIMAGMWGWKKRLGTLGMSDLMANYLEQNPAHSGSDQWFLSDIIWPKIKHSVMQHDSFFRDRYPGAIPFPNGDDSPEGLFVGERVDANENPEKFVRQARRVGKRADEIVWSNELCEPFEKRRKNI